MAQLLKLQDYVSRYEQDVYYYCSEYPSMKRQFWESTLERWRECKENPLVEEDFLMEDASKWDNIKKIFRKNKEIDQVISEEKVQEEIFLITDKKLHSIETEEELKQVFLDELLTIQLRWASSTSTHISPSNRRFKFDDQLRFFIQRLPDQYLYFHRPVVIVRSAPVELDMILLTPTQIYVVTILTRRDNSVLIGSKEKFWLEKFRNEEHSILNPLISLNRSSKIIQSGLQEIESELPVTKVLIYKDGYIDYPNPPADLAVVDKRNFEEWFQGLRKSLSPVKYNQVKAAQQILKMCHVNARERVEPAENVELQTRVLLDDEKM